MQNDINLLLSQLHSTSDEEASNASKKLATMRHDEEVVSSLCKIIEESSSYSAINYASLSLREIKSDKATVCFINAIQQEKNLDHLEPLVYALETHDCSYYFSDIFRLVFLNKPMVAFSAYAILENTFFVLNAKDIKLIRHALIKNLLSDYEKKILDNLYFKTNLVCEVPTLLFFDELESSLFKKFFGF